MKISAIIPARLNSQRFPSKILLPIHGVPLIEHVRRRALLCKSFSEVIVATCDNEIAATVISNGGQATMTSQSHANGTSRCAEAAQQVDCSHVFILQGDEPLLLPRHIEALVQAVVAEPDLPAWNLIGPLETLDELERHSLVKCAITEPHKILYCFRRSPHVSSFVSQRGYVRKMFGILCYRKDFLLQLASLPVTPIEKSESIEQMRILENGFALSYVEVAPSLPSINLPGDVQEVLDCLSSDREQRALLKSVVAL